MKRETIFFIFFILLSTLATAQESNEDGGILPTSKFWSADLIVEKITVLLTPSIEAKIQKELEFAEERNKELVEVGIDANEIVVDKIEVELNRNLNNAEKLGAKISDLAKQQEFNALVMAARQHHLDVLEIVKLQVHEKAKERIQRVLDREIKVPEVRVGY